MDHSDCTTSCKSEAHGNILTSSLTKRGVSDDELCSFLDYTCAACGAVRDDAGRSALHMAASNGRTKICQWIVENKGAVMNAKDRESGYTPLHRSIFYGKLDTAVQLIKQGANVSSLDHDNLTPLEHAMKDIAYRQQLTRDVPCQMYVWGSNTNNTLGMEKRPKVPELLDSFHKELPQLSVRQICLDKYHCVMVCSDGTVYSCGHGHGGRLGLNTKNPILVPQRIALAVPCVQASIARDHTLLLTDSGQVYVCGLNTHSVLGLRPPPAQVLVPRQLQTFAQPLTGICAAKYHSVAWGPDGLYTWGLNGGQLGHDKTSTKVITPKVVKLLAQQKNVLNLVAASDGATIVVTDRGDIYVLHEYQCRKIASKQLNIAKVVAYGGHLDSKVDNNILMERGGKELKVLTITNDGNVLLWHETVPQLTRCIFSNRSLIVSDAMLNRTHVVFVTTDGEGYDGEIRLRRRKPPAENNKQTAFHNFLNKDDCHVVKVNRLPNVHRAVSISTDPNGANFAVLQTDPRNCLLGVPEASPSRYGQQLLTLLNDADVSDSIHDVVFKVAGTSLPAHRYVIAENSQVLFNVVEACADEHVVLSNVNPKTFRQLLEFMYCKTVDFSGKYSPGGDKDPVRTLQEAAKRFGVTVLYKLLNSYAYKNGAVFIKQCDKKDKLCTTFQRTSFPELHDVEIFVRNGKTLSAHKCILAARLEYFNNLFATRWNEDRKRASITLPISLSVLEALLEYLYTDNSETLNKNDDLDYICNVLVVSDQLFITRLKEKCETIISSRLTLKNIVSVLDFAFIYNAEQLKKCCMEFICLNLTCLLESQSLASLDEDVAKELTVFYSTWKGAISYRVITPYSNAPDDETVLATKDHQFRQSTPEVKKKRTRRTRNRLESGNSISEEISLGTGFGEVENILEKHTVEIVDSNTVERSPNSVRARLKAIETARTILQSQTSLEDGFVCLNTTPKDFPELGGMKSVHTKSPHKSETCAKTKPAKISQKQRKKMWDMATSPTAASPETTSPLTKNNNCPWNISNNLQEKEEVNFKNILSQSGKKKSTIVDIIAEEKKQKQNWNKMTTKSLMYTQMEDKAIAELHRFYNTDNVEDELITVERIEAQAIAIPTWLNNKSTSSV